MFESVVLPAARNSLHALTTSHGMLGKVLNDFNARNPLVAFKCVGATSMGDLTKMATQVAARADLVAHIF